MKCKNYNYVLYVWRKVDLLLLVNFWKTKSNATSQTTVSSSVDRSLTCCVFSENSWESDFSFSRTVDGAVVSWFRKLLLLVTFIFTFVVFGKTRYIKKYEENYSKLTRKELMFGWTYNRIQSNYTVYPSSFDQYFKDVTKRNKDKLMNYEWARYATYESFPRTSVASPMRLAKAGFYYKGAGEEAVCFSCGLKNNHWSDSESVMETHKRLSPDCQFINGSDTTNVPIHVSESGNSESVTAPNSDGACGGPSDADHQNAETTMPRAHNGHTPTRETSTINGNETATPKPPIEVPERLTFQNGDIERFPGIHRETPKFPDYAIKSRRILTFSDWSTSHLISSASLAESGFFYTGPHDAVRCFFCGGGMKSWQYGDNPWIEHARWFPNCAYVRQFRGDNFINMCRAAHIDTDLYDQITQSGSEASQTNDISDRQIEDLNSGAAKTVLDMGYTQEQVEEAIRHHHQRRDVTEIRIQHLLEYLLDNTYTPSHGEVPENSRTKNDPRPPENASQKTSGKSSGATNKDANALAEENETLKDKMLCKICFDKDANIVFLPCGHMVSCIECAHALRKCAVCRKLIEGRIRTYIA